MISLKQYVTESSIRNDYGVLLDHIEFEEIPTLDKLTDIIKDGIDQATQRYKIIRIAAVEELNKKKTELHAEELKKALAKEEQRVVDYMKTKPGIMKRSEEKRQKYIDDKLEQFKASFRPAELEAVEFDESRITYAWHYNITAEHGYRDFSWKNDTPDYVASEIAKEIDRWRNNEYWDHLIGIDIAATSGDLSGWRPKYHIVPMFDEETEKQLSKSVQRFHNYMSREYNSDRYMGD